MDILSLTRNTTSATEHANPKVQASKPKPHQVEHVEETDKAPPNHSHTIETQKAEATRTGQKSPEKLLDLLKGLAAGTNGDSTHVSLNDVKVAAAVQKMSVPPTASDLTNLLSAFGIPVPQILPVASNVPNALIQGIEASNVPQTVKEVLTSLVKQASVTPLPASDLIEMGRVPAPTQATSAAYTNTDETVSPAVMPVPFMIGTGESGSETGLVSDSQPVPNSGQQFADDMVADLNPTMVTTNLPRASAAVQIIPNPRPEPKPAPVVIVPKPTQTGGQTDTQIGPAPIAKGRPQPHAELGTTVPVPETGPQPTIVPRPEAGIRPVVVPKPTQTGMAADTTTVSTGASGQTAVQQTAATGVSGDTGPKGNTVKIKAAQVGKADLPVTTAVLPNDPAPAVLPRASQEPVNPGIVATSTALLEGGDDLVTDNVLDSETSLGVPVTDNVVNEPSIDGIKTNNVDLTKTKEAPQPLPKETLKSVVDQISDRIETLVFAKKSSQVSIKLNPLDLGSITLSVKSFGSKIDAEVTASHEHVRAALEANRQMLVQTVESRGLALNSFNVGQEQNSNASHQGHQAAQAETDRNANIRQAMTPRPVQGGETPNPFRPNSSAVDFLI